MDGKVVSVLSNPLLMHSERLKTLAEQFRWKAENNIRFYEKLDMTTEQKVDFLAQVGEWHRLDRPLKPEPKLEAKSE